MVWHLGPACLTVTWLLNEDTVILWDSSVFLPVMLLLFGFPERALPPLSRHWHKTTQIKNKAGHFTIDPLFYFISNWMKLEERQSDRIYSFVLFSSEFVPNCQLCCFVCVELTDYIFIFYYIALTHDRYITSVSVQETLNTWSLCTCWRDEALRQFSWGVRRADSLWRDEPSRDCWN